MITLEVFAVLGAMCAALIGAAVLLVRWYERREAARGTVPVYTFAPAAVDATPRGPAAGAEATTYRPDPGVLSPYWQDKPMNVPAGTLGDPGPGSLPEGDTQMLWPPQEAPGPGALIGVVVYDDGNQLTKAVAASAAVAALPVDEYLNQLEDATAYTDERPFTDYLRDSVVMPAVKP